MVSSPPEEPAQCVICLDEIADVAAARTCGFCSKHICESCTPSLCELTFDGELDEQNGDLRCPNCRQSLVEGDLHRRQQAITQAFPSIQPGTVQDIVTLEDLIGRVMQLCAREDTGVEYYNVDAGIVAHAIAHDPDYTGLLERLLGSKRRARALRLSLRREPTNKEHVKSLCMEYMRLLTQAGIAREQSRRILEEVAEQSLTNALDYQRYSSVWKPEGGAAARDASRVRDTNYKLGAAGEVAPKDGGAKRARGGEGGGSEGSSEGGSSEPAVEPMRRLTRRG